MVIAIDGYSSTGKSSLAKMIAKKLKYLHIDSGAMYRAVTLYAIQKRFFNSESLDEKALIESLNKLDIHFERKEETDRNEVYLNGENVESEIRSMEVSEKVSLVATIPEVRSFLVKIQQKLGEKRQIVMDGRDIGTVVFPQADLKIFLTASAECRAKRRFEEFYSQGKTISYDEVLKNVVQRDEVDSNRKHSPLKKAADAIEIDNTEMNLEETFQAVWELIEQRNT